MTAYRMLNIPEWRPRKDATPVIQAPRARAVFTKRRLTYLDTREGTYAAPEGDGLVVNPELFRWPDLEEAPYLLVLAAFDDAGVFQDRKDAERERRALTGVLIAAAGRNVAGDHVFNLEVDLLNGNYIGSSGPLNVAFEVDALDLRDEVLDSMASAVASLTSLSADQQELVSLSTRWFVKGTEEEGHDAFISLWVAVETLAMPDGTNVRPVVQKLADLYGVEEKASQQMFQLGRLQGLRSQILHRGQVVPLDEGLNRYLAAIYRDLLKDRLGLAFGAHAKLALKQGELDVTAYLTALGQDLK